MEEQMSSMASALQVSDLVPADETQVEIAASARRAARQEERPNIGNLPLATDGAIPLFKVGERIVVERCSAFLNGDWLSTIVGKVASINLETGVVTVMMEDGDLLNPRACHVSLTDGLHDFRIAPPFGEPIDGVKKPIRKGKNKKKRRGGK